MEMPSGHYPSGDAGDGRSRNRFRESESAGNFSQSQRWRGPGHVQERVLLAVGGFADFREYHRVDVVRVQHMLVRIERNALPHL